MTGRVIGLVSRKWPPAMGGMETYAVRLSEALGAYGAIRDLVLPGRANGSPPTTLALLSWGLLTTLRLLLARGRFDAVLICDMAIWPMAVAAGGRKAIAAHGTDVAFGRRGGVRGRLYSWWLRLGASLTRDVPVVANSQATAALARDHGFSDVIVISLATDMRPPAPAPASHRSLLFAGRLVARKGCGWFIRNVLPHLPEDVTLRVAGTVWDEAEGEALASPRVMHLGALDSEALALEYASALAVIVPNIDVETAEIEGFGLVAVEAAAAGGIVLAAEHSGLVDAVIDGVTGHLLPPGDIDAWRAAVIEVAALTAEDRGTRQSVSRKAAAARFSWGRVAEETAEVLGLKAAP
ncbi:MAG: glycosyltransferase [Pseudomonadota bacterium]